MSRYGKNKGGRRGLTRREFITGAAAAAAGIVLPGCSESSVVSGKALSTAGLPKPEKSGIDHVVVLMMENRSFDHFLGWVPGADGVQAGVTLKDSDGNPHDSYDLAPNFQNCNLADPDHSYAGGRIEIADGRMDGFLLPQVPGDTFPIGYYTADSLPFFKGCAENWTICDRYFSGILSLTTPNRIYMHAGQTDRIANSVDVSSLPTIWDRMLSVGRSVAYYYTDVSYTSFWGDKYLDFSKKYDRQSFASDIASRPLANLTFIDNVGNTLNEGGAFSIDDHPYSDIRNGQAFLNDVYNALRQHPDWERTLLIINYDEWGGFYDHVPPPFAPITPEEAALGNDGRLGCRVPCVLIGPQVRRGHVESMQFDPNSILNMLAWRFGFEPLGVRANSNNIALALDFAHKPDPSTPAFDVPAGPFGGVCVPIQVLNNSSSPVHPPVAVPSWPVDPIPLPVEGLQMPSIPGFDVPVPSEAQLIRLIEDSTQRRVDHEAELQALREMGAGFGF
jgi:phospholipase C